MIIKYGTSEPATVVDAKNIPSWIGASAPIATKDSSVEDDLASSGDGDSESDQEEK